MDYYKILNIPHQADESQIKQAYRKLAKRYHPDLNPDNPEAEARFKDIVEAYETLGDPAKRRKYDANMIQASATMGTEPKAQKAARSEGAAQGVNFGNFTRDIIMTSPVLMVSEEAMEVILLYDRNMLYFFVVLFDADGGKEVIFPVRT